MVVALSNTMPKITSVFVRGFDFGTSEQALVEHMSAVGNVLSVEMKNGTAIVEYQSENTARQAQEKLNKTTVAGNSRFIDVWLDKKALPTPPPLGGGVKRSLGASAQRTSTGFGSPKVLVRGFDFGTSLQQILAHMGKVGKPLEVCFVTDGSANVVFSSPGEATAAMQLLNKSVINGNTRFIDVIPGGDPAVDPSAKRFKGGLSVRTPMTPAVSRPSGGRNASCKVLVRGFDFGTTREQLLGHMGSVGNVVEVHFLTNGSANVIYSSADEATAAVQQLNESTIAGNSRFIDVIAGGDLAADRAAQSCKVLVRGFDFGTSREQLLAHMGKVGNPTEVHFLNNGSANVIYSSADEATAAVQQLNKSIIDGNTRFVDVIAGGDMALGQSAQPFMGGFMGGSNGITQVQKMALGQSAQPFMGNFMGNFMENFMGVLMGGGNGMTQVQKGGGNGMQCSRSDDDPAGSGRVLVRGFDFGTNVAQLQSHMSSVGPIYTIHQTNPGSAIVVYASKSAAEQATSVLNKTSIPGNSRYIDVLPQ